MDFKTPWEVEKGALTVKGTVIQEYLIKDKDGNVVLNSFHRDFIEEIVKRVNEYEELKEQNIEYDRRISELEIYINSNRVEYSRQETIDKLDKENQELKTQNRELVELLKEIQWEGVNSWGMQENGCPICKETKVDGHKPNCKLKQLIEKAEGVEYE